MPAKGVDSIIELDLAADFDLGDPESLTAQIETGVTDFIDAIERFLSTHTAEAG